MSLPPKNPDPRLSDPRRDWMAPRMRDPETTGWVLPTVLTALVVAALAAFLLSGDRWSADRTRTATSPVPETTGQSTRGPVAPTPITPEAAPTLPVERQ
jgi:hypothetical protein